MIRNIQLSRRLRHVVGTTDIQIDSDGRAALDKALPNAIVSLSVTPHDGHAQLSLAPKGSATSADRLDAFVRHDTVFITPTPHHYAEFETAVLADRVEGLIDSVHVLQEELRTVSARRRLRPSMSSALRLIRRHGQPTEKLWPAPARSQS